MFVDKINITVQAGNGGNGMTSFRREAHVAYGGPYGGDGGRGGHIVFEADSNKSTLLELRYNKILKAENGEHGKSKKMHGRSGNDLILKVPVGTVVKRKDNGDVVADLIEHGQRSIVAYGGRGGRGNARFASANNPAPRYSEKGYLGEEIELELELKLLADVGLIGFPSVGKSTLLSVISKAKPEIAEYPFTTIVPNLGIARSSDGRSFAVADLPGLIEEAHLGKGLGHVFLRHIERCRVLVHVLDMSGEYGRDPLDDYEVIMRELKEYNEELLERPMIIAANKMDMPNSNGNLERFKEKYPDKEVFPLVTLVNEGTPELLLRLSDLLENIVVSDDKHQQSEKVIYRYETPRTPFTIKQINANTWSVDGEAITELFRRFEFTDEQSFVEFGLKLKSIGVDEALRKKGVQNGDTILLENIQFVFEDHVLE